MHAYDVILVEETKLLSVSLTNFRNLFLYFAFTIFSSNNK